MKKIISILAVITIAMTMSMTVMAEEKEEERLFEVDENVEWLSVYNDGPWVQTNHLKEEYSIKEEDFDFYNFFFCEYQQDNLYPNKIYIDCSESMEKTFQYEKKIVLQNMESAFDISNTEVIEVCKKGKTDLYPILNQIGKYNSDYFFGDGKSYYNTVIVTDLWNTKKGDIEEYNTWQSEVIFCVPYVSTNKEAVLHCEEFIENVLFGENYWWESCIYVVYMDEVIIRYDNFPSQWDSTVQIYVP